MRRPLRWLEAIGRFEEYARAHGPNLSDADRANVEKHVADCKASLASERNSTVQPPPVDASPITSSPEPKPLLEEPLVTVEKPAATSEPAERHWGLLAAGIATGTVGVGGIVAGILLNAKVNQLSDEMEAKPGAWSSKQESTQSSYKTLSMVGYGVGAVGIVTGAVLIGFGAKSRAESSSEISFIPMFSANLAGAMLRGAF